MRSILTLIALTAINCATIKSTMTQARKNNTNMYAIQRVGDSASKTANAFNLKNKAEIWQEDETTIVETINNTKYIIRSYYKNGQLSWEEPYVNGELHGIHKAWYPNGQLKMEGEYVNSIRHGTCKWWYKDGQLKSM